MDRRRYLKTAGAVVTTGLFAGCSGGDGGDSESGGTTYGTLSTSVTDQPTDIGDFESCVVTLQGLWVKPAGDGETPTSGNETDGDGQTPTSANGTDGDGETAEDDDSERRYVEFDEAQSADLVGLQGSNTQLIEETELETGEYEFLQLDVTGIEATLEGGGEAEIETPGNAPLKFDQSFEVRENERTQFVADFTPVERGNGSYIVRPVASGTAVLYGDEEYNGGGDDATADGGDSVRAGGEENATTGGNGSDEQ